MEKIKHLITNSIESELVKDILTIIIVILVGLGSFGLGRLSKQTANESLKIEYKGQEIGNTVNTTNTSKQVKLEPINTPNTTGSYFASSKGSKYYTVDCSAGKTIKQENRVYFETGEGAEQAGYELSTSCR